MIDSYFRNSYQTIAVDPIVNVTAKRGVTPTVITICGLIVGLGIIPSLAWHHSFAAVILLLTSGYLDTLDGSIARATNTSSPKGTVLDILCDRIVEFGIILGLFLAEPERGLACLLMLGSVLVCVTSFLVVGIFSENNSNKSFHYSPGLMERTEAFILFALMILMPQYFHILGILFTCLVMLTAIIRIYQFQKH